MAKNLKTLQALAQAAEEKKLAGEKLTAKDKRDIQRFADALDDEKRREHYEIVPRKYLVELAGRQNKLLDDAYRMHGVPCNGPESSLFVLIKWFFDYLAEHGRTIAKKETEDDLSKRRIRDASFQLKAMEIATRRKQLIPRVDAHTAMAMVAFHLRNAGLALQERFGRDALDLLSQHLDQAEAEIQKRLSEELDAEINL